MPTVVLVHGLARTKFDMLAVSRRLRREGYTTVEFDYRSRRNKLDDIVHQLHRTLEERRATLEEPLSFVGHSLGCVVIRRFAQLYGLAWKFHRCVMLGPPNQGARIARVVRRVPLGRWFFGPVLDELADLSISQSVGSLEVGIIAGGIGTRGFLPLLGGDNDFLVRVEETRLLGSADHIRLRGFHAIMTFQPGIIGQTVHFLREGRFERSGENPH